MGQLSKNQDLKKVLIQAFNQLPKRLHEGEDYSEVSEEVGAESKGSMSLESEGEAAEIASVSGSGFTSSVANYGCIGSDVEGVDSTAAD